MLISTPKTVYLKKREDRRIRSGHPWVFSNEINTTVSPLKNVVPGDEVLIANHQGTLLGRGYINPHSLISVRLLTFNPEESIDQVFFDRRLKEALYLRTHLFDEPYYRLVFGEADNLPGLVIDRFNNDYVMQINTAFMEQKIELIINALSSLLPNIHSILLRNDSAIREQEGLERYVRTAFGTPNDEIIIKENGVSFCAPLLKGQKTGWFYDHRMNRARLNDYAKDRKILDVFSYVGAWGIEALAFGAKKVDFIDSSTLATSFIQKNAEKNGFADQVKIICDDAFDAMNALAKRHQTYDLVILDPPAFVKKSKDRQEGLNAYQRLNELALKLLESNGILITCSCSMHVKMDDLIQILKQSANRTQSNIQILERGHQGPDHPLHVAIPETDYLKAIIVRKTNWVY